MFFRIALWILQVVTACFSASLICFLIVQYYEGIWLHVTFVIVSWAALFWVMKQDLAVLEKKFYDYFLDDGE